MIDKIKVGNVEHVEPVEIANDLCNYYSNIVKALQIQYPPLNMIAGFTLKKSHPVQKVYMFLPPQSKKS